MGTQCDDMLASDKQASKTTVKDHENKSEIEKGYRFSRCK